MATPRLNQLSLDLSKLLNDQVLSPILDGEDYTANQRLLAINRIVGVLLSKAVMQEPYQIIKDLPELITEQTLVLINGSVQSPANSIRIVSVAKLDTLFKYYIYTKPEDWYSTRTGYNSEEAGSVSNSRWTEFGGYLRVYPEAGLVTAMYVKDHYDCEYNGTLDIQLPLRYDAEILKGAYEFLTQLLVTQ